MNYLAPGTTVTTRPVVESIITRSWFTVSIIAVSVGERPSVGVPVLTAFSTIYVT